jgi:hypothetical protein
MKSHACLFLIALLFLFHPFRAAAGETYAFDVAEFEKKAWHFGGYLEVKPLLYGLDHDSASSRLRFYDDPQGMTLPELNGKVQLEGSFEKDIYRLFVKTNTDLKYSNPAGGSERSVFHEAFASLKPSDALKIVAGKKAMKWGKGYAWNPAAFIDRPKDPDDPELGMEGFVAATADYIRSFDGPLKTFSFTPVVVPVYDHVNDDFGNSNKLNFAGRFYFLLYDTDIDLMFLTGGSRSDRYGLDFSRNIAASFEIHGEYAFVRNSRKTVLDKAGKTSQVEADAHNYLVGIRHLTTFDLTTIVEYYHNDTGFSDDERANFTASVDRAYVLFQTTGQTTALTSARSLADGGYSRPNSGVNYLYVRLSQKEPFDLLYFTPSLTWMVNMADRSCTLTPELAYTGFTNWDLRFRTAFLAGGHDTEFGGKQNDYRAELRVGRYF